MKILHPFMPFITEEIWQRIQKRSESEALTISSWPAPQEFVSDPDPLQLFSDLQNQVSAIRNIQAEMNLPPRSGLSLLLKPAGEEDRKSTRLNSSHVAISYAVICLKKKTKQ